MKSMKSIYLLIWWFAGMLVFGEQLPLANTPPSDQPWQTLTPDFLVASLTSQVKIDPPSLARAQNKLLTQPDDIEARMTVAHEALAAKRFTEAASHYQRLLRHSRFERSACIAYLYALYFDENPNGTRALINQLEDYFAKRRPELRVQVDLAMRRGNTTRAAHLQRQEKDIAFVQIVAQCLAADLLLQQGQRTFGTLKLKQIRSDLEKIPLTERGQDHLQFSRWVKQNLSVAEEIQ